jgi:hypothetical protein
MRWYDIVVNVMFISLAVIMAVMAVCGLIFLYSLIFELFL